MAEEDLTLFYNDYSICSIMVRYTVAVGRDSRTQKQVNIIEHPINIQHGGQLAEFYLCASARNAPGFVSSSLVTGSIALWRPRSKNPAGKAGTA